MSVFFPGLIKEGGGQFLMLLISLDRARRSFESSFSRVVI